MMPFEKITREIDSIISISAKDRQSYTYDFDQIRNHLTCILKKEDEVFRKIYGGPSLFGSYIDNLKIEQPDEFDVHLLLKLPFYEHIKLKRDNNRPGFVKLCLSKVMYLMENAPEWKEVYTKFVGFVDGRDYLCRNKINNWLESIINSAILRCANNQIVGYNGDIYELFYTKRGTAHTIRAISQTNKYRVISIDFVSAFKFDARSEWLAKRPFPNNFKEKLWFAVPKPTVGKKNGRFLTFSICAPQVEKHLLQNKMNLKSSLRLFKRLRNKSKEYKLKSYFIKSIYLLENENQNDEFWEQPPGFLLIHMLNRLVQYLEDGYIPFYWSDEMNLLGGLTENQIHNLTLWAERNLEILMSYSHQPQIRSKTVQRFFDVSQKSLSKELDN